MKWWHAIRKYEGFNPLIVFDVIGVVSVKKVDFSFWADETEKAITEIYRVKSQIQSVGNKLKTNNISNNDFQLFLDNVYQTLNYWTGNIYIGLKKDKAVQKAFQTFFEALYDFLLFVETLIILCFGQLPIKFCIVVLYIDI